MVNWRTYRITGKSVYSNYIQFNLDNYVNYSNGNYQFIYCGNYNPFYNWRENDYIEIDNDQTRCYSYSTHFGSTNQVRLTCCHGCGGHGCGHSHTEYEDLKTKYSALERERNDLRTDRDSWRKKHDELKDQLNNEKIKSANEMANEKLSRQSTESTLRNEKKLVEEKLENFKFKS